MPKTKEEIEQLKSDWRGDPCWDIEDTEGFEEHSQELYEYRHEQERIWRGERTQVIYDLSVKLGCAGNLELAEYVQSLERRIEKLEEKDAD